MRLIFSITFFPASTPVALIEIHRYGAEIVLGCEWSRGIGVPRHQTFAILPTMIVIRVDQVYPVLTCAYIYL